MMRKKLAFLSILVLSILVLSMLSAFNLDTIKVNATEIPEHDIAVSELEVNGYVTPVTVVKDAIVPIRVLVKNQGRENETFDVTVYYNDTLIEMKTEVFLESGRNMSLTFVWNTAGVTLGAYKIKAVASTVPGEMDIDNNTFVSYIVTVIFSSMILSHITVTPLSTVDETLTPGSTYTISVKTDYTGDDINSWQFTLSYNPNVLQLGIDGLNYTDIWTGGGIPLKKSFEATGKLIIPDSEDVYVDGVLKTKNVDYTINYLTGMITFTIAPGSGVQVKATYLYCLINGDLINKAKDISATFNPGNYDNVAGKLTLTGAFFFFIFEPAPLTYGPGTLANVTFTVVGVGKSNITLGPETKLIGITEGGYGDKYNINAEFNPSHVRHGYFSNVKGRDVAITSLNASAEIPLPEMPPDEIPLGDPVSINVTVANEGAYDEDLTLAVSYDSTEIGNTTFSLNSGLSKTVFFNWNTMGVTEEGNYTITAEAEITQDDDPTDNTGTTEITLKKVHDVAVIGVEVPDKAIIGTPVTINVTVANKGHYEENVSLTVSYGTITVTKIPWTWYGDINTTSFTLAPRPASTTISVIWDTTGVTLRDYTINATAIIPLDIDLKSNTTDNKNAIQTIALREGPDISVTISAPTEVFIGSLATIKVTVSNTYTEDATFEMQVTYDTNIIRNQSVTLPPQRIEDISFPWNTTGLPPGSYNITAKAILRGDPKPRNNLAWRLINVKLPLGTIAGTVLDASTEDPIEGATITANGYSVTTDTEGRYTIQLLHGTYTVTASAAKYHSQSKPVNITAETTTTLNFTLTPINGTISGTVTDSSTGNPIAGATVTANGISVSTGADGTYTIEVPPGTYNVTVSMNGYKDSSKTDITVGAEEAKIVDFELTPIQPLNILLYAGVAAIAIVIIGAIAVYFLKFRKPT